MEYSGLNRVSLGHPMTISGAERPKVQKWLSDIFFVNIGHLDHYVLFGTKFGTVQDFQTGKKGPIRV